MLDCLQVKVEMCFVAPKSGGKLRTYLSLCTKMCGSINGFFHDKLTELNVFPWPHPFTPGATGKITKQRKRRRKEGFRERQPASQRKTDRREEKCSPCNLARPLHTHMRLNLVPTAHTVTETLATAEALACSAQNS